MTESNPGPTEAPAPASVTLKVLIAEDHEYIRMALSALLGAHGVEVVGEADNGRTAVELAGRLRPDLVIMDMSMPDLAGPEATRRVRADLPTTRVIALSAHCDREWVEAALQAGASAYVLKDVAYDDLPRALEAVSAGRHFVSQRIPGAAAALAAHLSRQA